MYESDIINYRSEHLDSRSRRVPDLECNQIRRLTYVRGIVSQIRARSEIWVFEIYRSEKPSGAEFKSDPDAARSGRTYRICK